MASRGLAAIVAGLTFAALAACGSSDDGTQTKDVVKVGVLPGAAVAPFYLGMRKGFFAEQGLEIETQQAEGGAALLPAVTSGQLQFGYSNVASLMLAQQKGLPVQVTASVALQAKPGDKRPTGKTNVALLVAKNGGVRSAEDLAGKTIGVNTLKNIEEVLVKYAIDQAGGDSSKVKLVEVPTSQMPNSLAQGKVAAVVAFEPYVTVALDQGARILLRPFTALPDPAANTTVFFTSKKYAADEADVARRFTEAMKKSVEYAQAHENEIRAVIPTYTEMSPELANQLALPYWSSTLNVESMKQIGQAGVTYGLLNREPDLDALLPPPGQR
ncbi:MAG: transporter substrate-binding domain-containing protein [Streptosporangiales bacterium]|nr:transporter substrate-binding domain-containing protein [Streptosporangiales bacterium]